MKYILSEILSVFGRCLTHYTFKVVVKISQVIVSTIITDLGDGLFGFDKHLGCNTNANSFHILRECAIGLFLKIPAKRTWCHMQKICNILKFYTLFNVQEHIFINSVDPVQILGELIWHIHIACQIFIVLDLKQVIENSK